eukprot:CAMPEP_0197437410 /NCGR_PEP_ID=MMETSP1175-20131217/4665_1 /TAXON_ID=1003142 /ORGANISM="Triceratium dubium, Strain CCMP147" /LENGTH=246 /DNA_ID=CAMNT_0042966929 /DNA_START=46 /DNA_END=786 /DNA_ORIENTATION=+
MPNTQRLAAIVGAGPGNGAAFARKFLAEGYKVALLSRKLDAMTDLAATMGPTELAKGYACDVTQDEDVNTAMASIQKDFGVPITTVIYNAGSGGFKPMEQWTPAEVTNAANINAAGLHRVALAAYPQFKEALKAEDITHTNLVVVGAGASTRGRPMTLGFAAGKAAQRSVAQSLARAWDPEKIHVSYMIVDGLIDTVPARSMMPKDTPDDFFLKTEDIAQVVYDITEQKPSAWTFEFDVRPFGEKW